MGQYIKFRDESKSFDGNYRKCSGSRNSGGANLIIKSVPDNLKTLTVTVTASPNDNGDGGLYKISLRSGGADLPGAILNTSKTKNTSFSYTFQKSEIFAGKEYDIRYWNNSGGWDSSDPCDYYRQDSEDSVTLAAYTGDTKLGDGRCTVTLSESATFDEGGPGEPPSEPPPSCCPAPPPWPTFTCAQPPNLISSSGGLILSKTGEKQVTLNLKNYKDKLVTLRITHEVSAAWTQSFSFNIPNCSDISPDTGGLPYSKGAYSNPNISGTNTITLYNVDGGDYNYVFNCDSVTPPKPTRQNCYETFYQSCSTSGDPPVESCVPVCVPNFYTEEYPFAWPPCPQGVAIAQTGGSTVRWYYEDGGGEPYGDQIVTITVLSTRDIVPDSGTICTSTLKNSIWNGEPSSPDANCFANYINYNDKLRYRVPSSRASRTTLSSPACYSDFRNVAGARPGTVSNTTGNQYSILHLIDEKFEYDNTLQINVPYLDTTSLIYGAGISVSLSPANAERILYPASPPEFNNTTFENDQPHYVITPNNLKNVAGASISVGQKITADNLVVSGAIQEKHRVNNGNLEVWFYIDEQSPTVRYDSVLHTSTDLTSTQDIIVQAVGSVAYLGNQAQTIDVGDTYHYEITFNDQESDALAETNPTDEFIVSIIQTKTNLGSTVPISISKTIVENSTLKVWFTTPGDVNAGEPAQINTFVRDWRVQREVTVNYKGYTFIRNWYITDGPEQP